MGRPRIEDDPLFAEGREMLAKTEGVVEQAKRDAEAIVRRAQMQVEQERLDAVRYLKERGMSNYGIGRLTGVTRHDLLVALVERAMRNGAELAPVAKVETITINGFEVEKAPDAEGYTWVTGPDGVRYCFGQTIEGHTRWYLDGVELNAQQQYDTLTYALEEYASLNARVVNRHSED